MSGPSADQVRALFARRRGPTSRRRGDHDGNDGLEPSPPLREAAVLVPLVVRPPGLSLLLTRRTAHLANHAGQISFPGGRVEADDADSAATALREAEEEVGLPRDRVEVLGELDRYITRTGFSVAPVVGLVHPPFTLTPDPQEVAATFEVPLAFILDPANRRRQSREFLGVPRHFWTIPYGEHFIWGATAGMLVNLCEELAELGHGSAEGAGP